MRKVLYRLAVERGLTRNNLNLQLVDDQEIAELNRAFLSRRGTTDVIAFSGDGELLGELAISIDTAKRQAGERGIPLAHELMLLAVHGMLHLAGYDDGTMADWRMMRIAEFEMLVKVL